MASITPKCGIYKIVCKPTGKAYFGSTKDWKPRKSQHLCCLRKGKHHSVHLQRAWNKYGEENFEFVWVENVSPPMLLIVEQKYLDKQKHKMNMAITAESSPAGLKCSDQRRQRVKAALKWRQLAAKGYHYDKNHKWTIQFRLGGKRLHWFFQTESETEAWVLRIKKLIEDDMPYEESIEQREYRETKHRELIERITAQNKAWRGPRTKLQP